ncbi:MAG: hypothetical protein AB8G77_13940 [Rhodothermales bacterium]
MSVVFAAFWWFLFQAYRADKKKQELNESHEDFNEPAYHAQASVSTPSVSTLSLSANVPVHQSQVAAFASTYTSSNSDTLSYQPLSTYLTGSTLNGNAITSSMDTTDVATLMPGVTTIQFDIKDIPGINGAMEKELFDLGYTSVEQIARWGRADVRAVSATLGVDQQKIEDEWIAGARLILSIR